MSSLTRRIFSKTDPARIASTLTPWADAVKKLAAAKQVPVVDLHALSIAYCESIGPERTAAFNFPDAGGKNDTTHLQGEGRVVFARLVVDALRKAVPALAPHLRAEPISPLTLWYGHPAVDWDEAFPVGNGRMGAMVFGGTAHERIQFNEDTIWTGEPHEYQHEGAVKFLPELRRLLAEGKQKEAEELGMKEFMGVPLRQKAYQPCADLLLDFAGHEAATDYVRTLDLDDCKARRHFTV